MNIGGIKKMYFTKKGINRVALILVLFLTVIFSTQMVEALNFKSFLKSAAKTVAIGFAVDKLAGPINSFINTLLANNNAAHKEATKVVPIVTAGREGHVGACQVTGTKELLDTVSAVVMLESDYHGNIRIKAMIPSNSKNPFKFNRVHGVGVSAIIDTPIN